MASITIDIADDRLKKLHQLAQERGMSPEALLQTSVDTLLSDVKTELTQAANYVLQKNAELYRRLA
jgi:antitoxin FitA